MSIYKTTQGRLVNDKQEWVWDGESVEYVMNHPNWLPLVFKNTADANKFKELETAYREEQNGKKKLSINKMANSNLNSKIKHYVYGSSSDSLMHYGVKGQHWGIQNGPPYPLSDNNHTVFISGSSKTQFKDSGYYRKALPTDIKSKIDEYMSKGDKIIVGDAPGIDRQVQNYLKTKGYDNVEVYSPGDKARYIANKKWKSNLIDSSEFEEGSSEWSAKKDKAMTKAADEGLAIVLDEGSKATKRNVERLLEENKNVTVYELNKLGKQYDKYVEDIEKILKDL